MAPRPNPLSWTESSMVAQNSPGLRTGQHALGLVVNPAAGPLSGEDAIRRCASRIRRALTVLGPLVSRLRIVTGPGACGQDFVESILPGVQVVGSGMSLGGSGATRHLSEVISRSAVDLLLFAGGDGTARDVQSAVGDRFPVLGIPTGCNMHSGVFAATPECAGEIALSVLRGETTRWVDREVLGRNRSDEHGIVPLLFGYLRVPAARERLPGAKASMPPDAAAVRAMAAELQRYAGTGDLLLFGAGGTTTAILDAWGERGTVGGVDVVRGGRVVATDVDADHLRRLAGAGPVRIVVSPVGGQSFLFGRGTPQFSDDLLGKVGPDNVMVVAARRKLDSFRGQPLRLDLDDQQVLRSFPFSIRVMTGEAEPMLYPLSVFQS